MRFRAGGKAAAWAGVAALMLAVAAWGLSSMRGPEKPRSAGAASRQSAASQTASASLAASAAASPSAGATAAGKPGSPAAAAASSPAPAAEGAPLEDLASPPGPTVASFDPSRHEPGARYRLVFEPYGYGPETAGPTIAARIVSCTPEGGGADDLSLAGRSALLVLGKARIERGGTYEGTAALTEAAGRLVLVLEEARLSG